MAGKIFINCRREDSIAIAGRLHDRLAETFGRDNLFMDVDNIPVGINFEEYLKSQVAACDAVLSVIGPNWLNAKDESDQRRLDKPDDFVAIEIAAALARDILVIPVLVDGTRMPKAGELPASLKPLALRNAIQVRNTNFGSDAEQLITKMREALALGRPERTQELVLLWFNTHLVAAFLINISVFLAALSIVFQQSVNYAGALAAMVAAAPISLVGGRTLARDESVRMLGLVVSVGGLLAVAAIIVSPQFFRVGLLESRTIQSGSLMMGIYFLISVQVFGLWKKMVTYTWMPKATEMTMIMANSRWLAGFTFLSSMLFVVATWEILYRLTDSVAAALALVCVHLLVVGYCYFRFRQALAAANPAPASR
ncbi:MAG: toll/interleukin-1 receptor domain-containing protein [Pseudolabrys sp.]